MISRPLLVASAGLGLQGGGAAHLGRLVVGAAQGFAEARRIPLSICSLDGVPEGLSVAARDFRGRRLRFVAALLRAQLRAPRPVIVFDHLGPARVQALLAAPARSRYALFLLGLELQRPLSPQRRRALRGASLRLAISEHTRRLTLAAGAPDAVVIHPALEETAPEGELDRALIEELGRDFVLVVGRMAVGERYKGHDELIECWPTVRAAWPGARLVLAGEGDDRPRLEAYVAERGLAPAVRFTGFVSSATLAALYERCALLALPSRGEGFGLVYLEAMRVGKPCVAAPGTAAAEVVLDGETGLLVDPSLRDDLAAGIASLLRDSPRRARLGEAGRARWEACFRRRHFEARFDGHLAALYEAA